VTAARRQRHALSVILALSLVMAASWPHSARADLRLIPNSISIGALFSGMLVRVVGEIPAGSNAVVEVIGKRIEEQVLRKGRHLDIWMNEGEIDIENSPCLYFALSTDPSAFSRWGADAQYGYTALRKQASFTGDTAGMTSSEVFQEFVDLKQQENLYRLLPGALKMSPSAGNRMSVEGTFRIPSRVTPGDYVVRLSVVSQGRKLRSETAHLVIHMVGLPAFLATLARRHGALYGLLAIAIAVIFGFLVGVLFKRRRHAH
jgi:hypothetical protein